MQNCAGLIHLRPPQRSDWVVPFIHRMAANHPSAKRSPQAISAGFTFTPPSNDLCVVYAALSACCDLNPARISDAKSSGSSHAAKCPPLSTSWK